MMKKRIVIVMCLILFNIMHAQQISAVYDRCSFYSPDGGPYLETYFLFDASSLKFVSSNEKEGYVASVEILLNLKRNDSIEFFKKYELKSPVINNPEDNSFSFMDVQRFALKNGIYTLEVYLKDKNTDNPEYKFEDKISIFYPDNTIAFSDIQFISEYKPTQKVNILSKSGYDMTPYIGYFFPKELEKITYYCEVYGLPAILPSQEYCAVYSYIENDRTGFKIDFLQRLKREKIAEVVPLFGSFDISKLPSGNYNLVFEIRNSENQTISYHKRFFQQSNPNMEEEADTMLVSDYNFALQIQNDSLLLEYIQSLDVIASPSEQDFIRKEAKNTDLIGKQQFFHLFWLKRNNTYPEGEWLNYKKLYDAVESSFSTKKRQGYKTDRGRIYLKYGPPDYVIDEKFKTSMVSTGDVYGNVSKQQLVYLPYQIWRYDLLPNNEPKRSFVFWVPQSAGFDYELLHSNARGEISDPYWERRLSRNQLGDNEIGEAGRQFERGY